MKRTVTGNRKILPAPSDLAYAALWGKKADTFDDRVSESLVDYEDEREVVDAVVQRMIHTLN